MHINLRPTEVRSVYLNSPEEADTFAIVLLGDVGYLTLKKSEVKSLHAKFGRMLANWQPTPTIQELEI